MKDNTLRYNLASLFKELNKLECDAETKKKYYHTIKEAIDCVEKCYKLVTLEQNCTVDLDFLRVLKEKAPEHEQYIKEKMAKNLAKSILKCGVVTVRPDFARMQNIYTLDVEVVNNNE